MLRQPLYCGLQKDAEGNDQVITVTMTQAQYDSVWAKCGSDGLNANVTVNKNKAFG
ncbi:MAG: hypothetical protein WCR48_03760 [Bacteroidales bacterium]